MDAVALSPEEQERADGYALLANLLLGPYAALLDALAAVPPDPAPGDELSRRWAALLCAAARRGQAALDEYDALFVAVGTPRVNPYECRYLAGWLMDKPLAQLREDLRELGVVRAPDATELEDHLGALCEAMRVLIESGAAAADQQRLFARHLAPWARRCLHDIATAPGADFYRAVAAFAEAFLAAEARLLGIEGPGERPMIPPHGDDHPLRHPQLRHGEEGPGLAGRPRHGLPLS